MLKRLHLLTVGGTVVSILAVAVMPVSAMSSQTTDSDLYYFNPFPIHGDQVEGASARLVTNDAGATVRIQTTNLPPGDAVTIWWVIFNNPEACADPEEGCTLGDLMGNTAAVGGEVTYATGHVIGDAGGGDFAAHLPVNGVENGWFGNNFTRPRAAEIHVVVHTHGPLIPDLASEMISTFRGGCADDWFIAPGHPAYGDGTPGPNQCKDLQFAVFQQIATRKASFAWGSRG